MSELGAIFGKSPDGWANRPLLRGPTENEIAIAYDVLLWAEQTGAIDVEVDVLDQARLILDVIHLEASGS